MLLTVALFAAVLVAALPTGEAAASTEIQNIAPGKPEVCKYSGRTIKVGQTWNNSRNCEKVSCSKGRPGTVVMAYESCGLAAAPPNCKLVQDKSKPYPSCCPTVKCPK